MDIFEKCYQRYIQDEVREQGVYPYFHALESRQDTEVIMEGQRRIMLGTYVLSSGYYDAYYKKARAAQRKIREEFANAFEKCDVILTPVAPTTAYEIGSKTTNPLEMYAGDICTVSVNIAGLPGLVQPCGFDENHMPVGMQLIGPRFGEQTLLNAGLAFEQASGLKNIIAAL